MLPLQDDDQITPAVPAQLGSAALQLRNGGWRLSLPRQEVPMLTKSLQFLALLLAAVALIPAGAHFFEFPGKIGLAKDQYFIVQGIYAGWSQFGMVLVPAVVVNFALAYFMRDQT